MSAIPDLTNYGIELGFVPIIFAIPTIIHLISISYLACPIQSNQSTKNPSVKLCLLSISNVNFASYMNKHEIVYTIMNLFYGIVDS